MERSQIAAGPICKAVFSRGPAPHPGPLSEMGQNGHLHARAGRAQPRNLRGGKGSLPSVPGASALTAAELRLLPLLPTHLSFTEIAAELFISPNTAKTHAVSSYRKLDAGTRGQAVAQARELGLLEG